MEVDVQRNKAGLSIPLTLLQARIDEREERVKNSRKSQVKPSISPNRASKPIILPKGTVVTNKCFTEE